ncbi:hypothetical protein [uncultured Bilophila sp.]|uniref:hypothetical protein n=1 Tax=uncultured Bilophila sp. TaxID=529385 RepID=UPI0026705C27|nr:hypothetical protein [uncultured Bilophila sp.]
MYRNDTAYGMDRIDALDCGEHIEDVPYTFTGIKQCCTPIIHKSHEVPYHGPKGAFS